MNGDPENAAPEGEAAPDPPSSEASGEPPEGPSPAFGDLGVAAVFVAGERGISEADADEAVAAKASESASEAVVVAASEAARGGEASTAIAVTAREAAQAGEDAKERMDLPKWNRARVKRKTAAAAVQEDAFQGTVRQAGRFTIQRAPVVFAIIVGIAALIAGVQWIAARRMAHRAIETRLLAEAVGDVARGSVDEGRASQASERKLPFPNPVFADEGKQAMAIDTALRELREDAEGSAADVASELVRAARALETAEFADAEAKYRAFIERHLEHELLFLAREGLALALVGQNELDEANTELERLSGQPGDFYRDQALWQRARLLEHRGDRDGAIELYKQYATEYPLRDESLACREVIGRLEALAPELVPDDARPGCGAGRMGLP